MSIRTKPGYRWRERNAALTYTGLDLSGQPTAIIEPETIGAREWDPADFGAIVTTAPAGVKGSIDTLTQTITAQTSAVLLAQAAAPDDATEDQQVLVGQTNPKVLYYGFIQIADNALGVPTPYVRMRGHNITTADAPIFTSGDVVPPFQLTIPYVIVRQPAPVQPSTPNAALNILPLKRWTTPNEAITAAKLNATGKPTAQVLDGSIGKVELNSRDVRALMALHIGKRSSFTVASTTTIAGGASAWTTLGTKAVTGVAIGDTVHVPHPGSPVPLYGGYVGSAGIVTLTARHNNLGTVTAPAGTVLHFIVF